MHGPPIPGPARRQGRTAPPRRSGRGARASHPGQRDRRRARCGPRPAGPTMTVRASPLEVADGAGGVSANDQSTGWPSALVASPASARASVHRVTSPIRPDVERAAPEDEPDRVDRHRPAVEQSVRDRRIECRSRRPARARTRRTRSVTPRRPLDRRTPTPGRRAAGTRAPGWTPRRPRTSRTGSRHSGSIGREPLPDDTRREADDLAIVGALDGVAGAGRQRCGRLDGHDARRPSRCARPVRVDEQQFVERDVELVGDRIQRADRRPRAARLDLGDEARRHPDATGQIAQREVSAAGGRRAVVAHRGVARMPAAAG